MRKLVVFLVFMNFLLLSGGSYLHADTYQNRISYSLTPNLAKNEQVKFANTNQASTVIEATDLDLDEEYLGGDNVNDVGSTNKLFTGNHSLLDSWYLAFSCQSVLNYHHNNFKNFTPFCGQSNPIYLTQGVLRI